VGRRGIRKKNSELIFLEREVPNRLGKPGGEMEEKKLWKKRSGARPERRKTVGKTHPLPG